MKRSLFALFLTLFLAAPSQAFDWSGVFSQITASVGQLFTSTGSCTAFSINTEKRYYLTAAHCLGDNMQIWKEATLQTGLQHSFSIVTVLAVSRELDLAVLEATEGMRAVTRGRNPQTGKQVASIGYAFGEPQPFIITANVAAGKAARSYGILRFILLKDNQDIPGMSGGPVLDTKGKLVGMVQSGVVENGQVTNIAYGTAVSDIYDFTKAYW